MILSFSKNLLPYSSFRINFIQMSSIIPSPPEDPLRNFTHLLRSLFSLNSCSFYYAFSSLYEKNVFSVKDSLQIPLELPDFRKIDPLLPFFQTKTLTSSSCVKKKVFLIWLISAYEYLTESRIESFVRIN